MQDDPDRWLYAVRGMTALLLKEDAEEIRRELEVTANVVEVLENMRREAGILFAGESPV